MQIPAAVVGIGLVLVAGWYFSRPLRSLDRLEEARQLLREGDLPGGVAALRQALEIDPRNGDAHLELLSTTYRRFLLPAYREYREETPDPEPQIFFGDGTTTVPTFKDPWVPVFREQLQAASPAASQRPFFEYRARFLQMTGAHEAALQDWRGLLRFDPDRSTYQREAARCCYHLGLEDFVEGDVAAAKAHFENGLAFDPEHPEIHLGLGMIALRSAAEGDAVRHFEASIRENPLATTTRFALAETYRRLQRRKDAVDQLWKLVIRLTPILERESFLLERSCRLARELVPSQPGTTGTRLLLRCAEHLQSRELRREALSQAPPDSTDPLVLLARAEDAMDDAPDVARELIERLLAKAPRHRRALQMKATLLRGDAEGQQAEDALKLLTPQRPLNYLVILREE